MFREICEVKPYERLHEKRVKKENNIDSFRDIKPENGMTIREAKSFMNNLFSVDITKRL